MTKPMTPERLEELRETPCGFSDFACEIVDELFAEIDRLRRLEADLRAAIKASVACKIALANVYGIYHWAANGETGAASTAADAALAGYKAIQAAARAEPGEPT